jgi:hypothetical protein
MMDVIDGDIAKYIWGFFLEFDDENTIPSTPMETSSISSGTESAMNNKNDNDNDNDNIYSLNRLVDFQSIRSLRVVNTFFYNAFDEFCGWSRCALAIKREYRILRNNDNSFVTWRFMLRAEALRANHHLPTPPGWTREQRRHIGKVVSKAMERKKLSVYRCKQLIWMLDRRPRLSLKGGL